jgi:hypothetical protein
VSQAPNFAELYTLLSVEANGLIAIASSDMIARITHIGTHHCPTSKALPPTNTDRDIERKLAPGISYTTHT